MLAFGSTMGVMLDETPLPDASPMSAADAERLADIMRALASPVRLRILSVLRARPSTVTELGEQLQVGQTTVSNHLRLLRHLSLVAGSREGRHIHYALFDGHVVDLLDGAIRHLEHLPRA